MKQASGGVYHWVDSTLLSHSVEPRRSIGVLFLLEFLAFAVFLVCLTLRLQEGMVPQKSLVTQQAAVEALGYSADTFLTLDDIKLYLKALSLIFNSANPDGLTMPFLLTHQVLGSVHFYQQRSSVYECARGGAVFECIGDVSTNTAAFEGSMSKVRLSYAAAFSACQSILCAPGFRSAASSTYYWTEGLLLLLFNGTASVNSSYAMGRNETAVMWSDFVDRYTRYLCVELVLLDSSGELLTQVAINFELPVVGGVVSWIASETVRVGSSSSKLYTSLVGVYCCAFLVLTAFRTIVGVLHRGRCEACKSRSVGHCATLCSSCAKPVCLDLDLATKCSWCGVVLHPLQHGCWRAQLDASRLVAVVSIVTICAAMIFEAGARAQLLDIVRGFLSTADTKLLSVSVAAPVDQLSRVAALNAFNILLAFVCLYRFMGRAPWIARFLKVFSEGGFMVAFFFVGFSAVYFGFMLSFHLLLGETTLTFATVSGAFVGTFQLLLGLLEWEEVSMGLDPSTFGALYFFFCWVCILVMMNVLISLVTAEYKRARKVQEFDVEAASCAMLFRRQDTAGGAAAAEPASAESDQAKRTVSEELDLEDVDATLPLVRSVKENIGELEASVGALEKRTRAVFDTADSVDKLLLILKNAPVRV